MNYRESIEYIHSIPKFRRPLGNANLSRLLGALGNPQKKLKFIHIAGTNGKGSVAAMTAEILKRSGYRTGLFTSPYIEVFNERIRINGEYIPDEVLAEYATRVKTVMEEADAPVSEFAFVTAAAFLYFYERGCDFTALEVGMGGRLDATNVIEKSLVSVICKIGLDHTQYLGNTIEEITREKCGIIKKGGAVVSYPNEETANIIKLAASENGAELVFAGKTEKTKDGFLYNGKKYPLALRGTYQPQNAAVTLETIGMLRKRGVDIPDRAVYEGLSEVRWAARFEYIAENIIIDGAHNIDGVRALKDSLLSLDRGVTLVIAMMEDKDYESCIREILPAAKRVLATQLDTPRCLEAEKICQIARGMKVPCSVNTNPADAVREAVAVSGGDIVCVCGSLYLAGEVRKKFVKNM